jgi:hypothetical protein
MKLLSQTQVQQNKDAERYRDSIRTQEVQKALQKSHEELAKAQKEFYTTMAENSLKWSLEEADHTARVREMKSEIELLEARKKEALTPIKLYEERAARIFKEAEDKEYRVEVKEREVDELRERLEDKLDEVGQREVDANRRDKELDLRERGIEAQARQTMDSSHNLTQQMDIWLMKQEREQKELNDKAIALIMQERSIEANRESLKRTEQRLSDWEKKLGDERATLERAFKRIEK